MATKIVMLDTNVVIDISKKEKRALEKLSEFEGYRFAISHLVYMEFMAGVQVVHKQQGNKFIRRFLILPYTEKAQNESIKYGQQYFVGRENTPVDLMIAAHVKTLNVPFVTNNADDFIHKGIKKLYHYDKSSWL